MRPYLRAIICGASERTRRSGPVTCTAIDSAISASVSSRSRLWSNTPALLTNVSTWRPDLSISFIAASIVERISEVDMHRLDIEVGTLKRFSGLFARLEVTRSE